MLVTPGSDGRGGDGCTVLGDDLIILGACDAASQLPTNPDLPADIFTCCLTTPLRMALRFASRNALLDLNGGPPIDTLPGALGDRRSPLGEINWVGCDHPEALCPLGLAWLGLAWLGLTWLDLA